MTHFLGLHTVAEVKTRYRELCFLHHPDCGGATATMQSVNADYQNALAQCHGETTHGSDGKAHTYYYSQARETALAEKLSAVVGMGMTDVEIMLIGSWLWVHGHTRRYAKPLGRAGLGLHWHAKRQAWYWHAPTKRRTRYNAHADLETLANTYGSKRFASKQRPALPL